MPALSQTLINKVIDREDASLLPTFCVIRDRVQSLITKEYKTVWLVVTKPVKSCSLEISEADALDLIDIAGLDEKIHENTGSVWDTPDGAYLRKYRGSAVKLD